VLTLSVCGLLRSRFRRRPQMGRERALGGAATAYSSRKRSTAPCSRHRAKASLGPHPHERTPHPPDPTSTLAGRKEVFRPAPLDGRPDVRDIAGFPHWLRRGFWLTPPGGTRNPAPEGRRAAPGPRWRPRRGLAPGATRHRRPHERPGARRPGRCGYVLHALRRHVDHQVHHAPLRPRAAPRRACQDGRP
jgi:hypothetical protein